MAAGPPESIAAVSSAGSNSLGWGIDRSFAAAAACRASRSCMVRAASEACAPEFAIPTSAPWAAPAPWPSHTDPSSVIAL